MAAGLQCLPSRVVIAVGASPSISGRGVAFHGRLSARGVRVGRERRRGGGTTCARSSSFEADSVDFSLPPHLTLYELLGISTQVGLPEIKLAYREKARRYHPDANPPSKKDECTKQFLRVQEAYEVLADPDARADYDYKLRHPLSMQVLRSGFKFKRGRNRGGPSPVVDDEIVVNKHEWRAQWEAQMDGLKRDLGRSGKAGSWAARMRQKRQEPENDRGVSW